MPDAIPLAPYLDMRRADEAAEAEDMAHVLQGVGLNPYPYRVRVADPGSARAITADWRTQ